MTHGDSGAMLETAPLPRGGRGRQRVLMTPRPQGRDKGTGECAVEVLRWGQQQSWLGRIPLQCEEGHRVTSPQRRRAGAVFKARAQGGNDQSLNPASAAHQLCKPVALPSLSCLLCMGRNHDVAFIWSDGSVHVACLMQCSNPSGLYTFWQLGKK